MLHGELMKLFFETDRCMVKPPHLQDLRCWQTIYPTATEISAKKMLRENITNYQKYGFSIGSIFLKKTNVFVGIAGLFYYPTKDSIQQDIELKSILHENFQNVGLGTELTLKLIDWSFSSFSFKTITALTGVANIKSQRVLEKVGMRYQQNVLADGEEFCVYRMDKA